MTDTAQIDYIGEPPAPFIRRFSAPAGAPWDQVRTVRLEALHGAPLPVAQLEIVLRRIEPWRPGAPAGFAAAYFRRDGLGDEQSFVMELDGRQVEFVARGDGARRQLARQRLIDLGLVGAAILMTFLAGSMALGRRIDLDSRLHEADVGAQRNLRAAREAQRRSADARSLDAAGSRQAQLSNALADIVWLSRARQPQAVVEEIDWAPDEMRVVARGSQSPIATVDRPISPSDESRPGGVRIWRVGPTLVAPPQRPTP